MIAQFIAIASEFTQSVFEVHDAISQKDRKAQGDGTANPVFKKSFLAKALFVGSVFFLNMYSLVNSLAVWMATLMSKPHSAALVAAACPPIINIVVFAATGLYSLIALGIASRTKNPHADADSDAYKDWQAQHMLRKAALGAAAFTSLFFLISSLIPLPGLTNYIGLGLGIALVAIDVVRLALYGRSAARSSAPSIDASLGGCVPTAPTQAHSAAPQNGFSPRISRSLSTGVAQAHVSLWQRFKQVFSKKDQTR